MSVGRPVLYLSYDPPAGRMSALEFGRVDDGQPEDRWEQVGSRLGLLHDAPGGRCVGFTLVDLDGYDVDDEDHADLWDAPRFDVPVLGLTDVAPNAIVVAARAQLGDRPSLNRQLFSLAVRARGEDALGHWRRCLQAGDSMAHFALGYTLFELGRADEAYTHLRHYCEIAPAEPWAWAWYGRAAAVCGETVEAQRALERAIDIEDPDTPTDATEVLERVRAGESVAPGLPTAGAATEAWFDALLAELSVDHVVLRTSPHLVLCDAHPIPVMLFFHGDDDELVLRAIVGCAEDEEDAEDALEGLEAIEDAEDVLVDGASLWLELRTAAGDGRPTRRELEIMLTGVAAEAEVLRARYSVSVHEGDELVASPSYDEWRAMRR